MEIREHIQAVRGWKNEGRLGEKRTIIADLLQANRNALFCEKIGYMLKNVAVADWQTGEQSVKPIKVAMISNFTSDAYAHMLRSLLLGEGIWPEVYTAGYNQYVYEFMLADSGLYQFKPQITLCLLDEHVITEELSRDWDAEEFRLACERKLDQLRDLVSIFQQRSKTLLVLNTIPLSPEIHHMKIDYKTKASISRIWRSFNTGLLELSEEWSQACVLDTEILLQEHRVGAMRDSRLMYHGGFYYSQEVLFAFAAESAKLARAVLGLTKKCAVLDLDNTLWGGIIGDDGLNSVQLGDTSAGNVFVEFQKSLKQLKNQGVLLAVSSKNEEDVVREMFMQHPHMQLSLDDIVIVRANWDPKPDNVISIAHALNIGIDSLVFIDDNPFERMMVREALPAVAVPHLPEDSSCYRETMLSAGWFNVLKLTETDKERTRHYQVEAKREQLKQASQTAEQYLSSLNIRVTLLPANEFHMPRLTQLMMRTNQFNLTTRRYQEAELMERMESGRYWVFGFQSADQFGYYGMIGAVIIEKSPEAWRIDNFLMSCRVFSRSIETVILRHVLLKAKEARVPAVIGEYIPSAKNVIVSTLYPKHGFEPAPINDDLADIHAATGRQLYIHRLHELPNEVAWIELMTGEEAFVS